MNTNDLPPAAKLAAMIETGRVANPDLKHGRAAFLKDGAACALGFAGLGAGASREQVGHATSISLCCALRLPLGFESGAFMARVVKMNDGGATLEEICASLREGELARAQA